VLYPNFNAFLTAARRQNSPDWRRDAVLALLFFTMPVLGCSLEGTAAPVPQAAPALRGMAHGGSSPVSGAEVYVMAAGTSGYGGASISLLTSGAGSTSLGEYVTSASDGSFYFPNGSYSCTAGQQVYVLALGGNPGLGSGQSNPSLAEMSILGTCPASKTFFGTVAFVMVNEVTTVAAVNALAGYMTDATHVSSNNTALSEQGIAAAFATAANLVSFSDGGPYLATPSTSNGSVPLTEINTLADILQGCVNSNGDSTTSSPPSACYSLFNATNNGTRPTDTVQAALSIAHHPGNNVQTLFGLFSASGAAFIPNLSQAPNDWTLAITYTDANIGLEPVSVAVDGSGNVWTIAQDQEHVVEYSNLGVPVSHSPFTGFSLPSQVAIDSLGNAWVGNGAAYGPSVTNLGVTKILAAGTSQTNYTAGSIFLPAAIAIDASNDIWTANQVVGRGNISHITDAGTTISGSVGPFGGTEEKAVQALAIDSSGDVWTTTGYNVLNRVSSTGSLLYTTSLSSYTLGSVAVDSSTNIWIADPVNGILGFSNSTKTFLSGSPYTSGGVQNAASIVLDGSANVWVASYAPLTSGCTGKISGITNAGVALSPSGGYTTPALSVQAAGCVYAMAIDGSGNIWYAGPDSMTEFVGVATPVHTPISPSALGTKP
jgi:streptogramin lyase